MTGLSRTDTGSGTVTVAGGALNVGGNTIVGSGNDGFGGEPGAKGSFLQSGGSHVVTGDLIVGQAGTLGGGKGIYQMSGGRFKPRTSG